MLHCIICESSQFLILKAPYEMAPHLILTQCYITEIISLGSVVGSSNSKQPTVVAYTFLEVLCFFKGGSMCDEVVSGLREEVVFGGTSTSFWGGESPSLWGGTSPSLSGDEILSSSLCGGELGGRTFSWVT